MKAKVLPEVVEQHFLLLLFLHLGAEPDVEIHHKGMNLATLPALPEPARSVEEDRLRAKCRMNKYRRIDQSLIYYGEFCGRRIYLRTSA